MGGVLKMGQRFQYVIKLKDNVEIDKNYDGQSKVESDKIALHHHWGGHVYSTQRLVQLNNHIQENNLNANDLNFEDVKALLFRNELTDEDTPMILLSQKDLDKPFHFDNNDGIVVIDLSKDEMSYTFVDLENRHLLDAEGYLDLYRSYPIDTNNPGLFDEQEVALKNLKTLSYEDLNEVYPELHNQIEREKEMEKYLPVIERFQEMKDNREINYYNDLDFREGKFDTVFNYPVDIQQMYDETKEKEVFDRYMNLKAEQENRMDNVVSITGMPVNTAGFYKKYDKLSEYQLITDISIEKEPGEGYKILTREGKGIYEDHFFQNRFKKMEDELNEFYQPKIQELNDMKMEIDKSLNAEKCFYRITDVQVGEHFEVGEDDLWMMANDIFQEDEDVEFKNLEEVIKAIEVSDYDVQLIDPKVEKELIEMDSTEIEKMLIDDYKEKEESLLNTKMFVRETGSDSIILGTYRMNEVKVDSDEMKIFKECFPEVEKTDFSDYVVRRTQEFDEENEKSFGESQLIIRKQNPSKEELKMTAVFNEKINEHFSNIEKDFNQNKGYFVENVKRLNKDKEDFVKSNYTDIVDMKQKEEMTKEKGMDLSL